MKSSFRQGHVEFVESRGWPPLQGGIELRNISEQPRDKTRKQVEKENSLRRHCMATILAGKLIGWKRPPRDLKRTT